MEDMRRAYLKHHLVGAVIHQEALPSHPKAAQEQGLEASPKDILAANLGDKKRKKKRRRKATDAEDASQIAKALKDSSRSETVEEVAVET